MSAASPVLVGGLRASQLFAFAVGVALAVATPLAHAALGDARYVDFTASPGALALAAGGKAAPILVDAADWPGVVRAANDLQSDVNRVTGLTPEMLRAADDAKGRGTAVLVGTVGKSPLIDRLVREKKIDPSAIAGRWESFLIATVANPLPGLDRALVVAGSDKRGTTYGIYDVSSQLGVSPWHWWADVTPVHHDALFVKEIRRVVGEPAVKYRGIFLNDEAPDLTNWIRAKFGNVPQGENPPMPANVANYGREFYTKLFEVILRLRGNYLWPAMWNNAFNEDDPENARLADEYGIVLGTSHQEPMLRAQKEWDRRFQRTIGTWNYAKHPEVLQNFWREGIRRNKSFESIVTMGLRGANDTEMAPGGPEANRALLEQIVEVQRGILREEVNPDVTRVPQVWCLYKEVQDYYDHGMRVPDDVTLLWAEDNWGNVRRLPTAEERKRAGGAGIYYHFDYHGGPRSYQWLNTSPLPKIWEQMSLAKQYGADRVWIVNVGHFKGYEVPMEFFLNFAWDTTRWNRENVGDFNRLWAAREFGAERATEIGDIVARYAKYNGRRKPEMLAPSTYSLTDYREAETVVADYDALTAKAEAIFQALPAAQRDAFYQLVLFPTKASALANGIYLAAARNQLYAKQGRASANQWADETKRLFQSDLDLMAYYNTEFAGGRWAHFMDQTHMGYTAWNDPPQNSLRHIALASVEAPEAAGLGVAVEGSAAGWPAASGEARLPVFDALQRQKYFIEVFNRGKTPFEFTAAANEPWIRLSDASGKVERDRRIEVTIDWNGVPKGTSRGVVQINGAGGDVRVRVDALNPAEVTRDSLHGFAEGQGVIAIEPEHFAKNIAAGTSRWERIADYGRTLSGMRAEAAVDAPSATPGRDSPCLEYQMYVFTAGPAEVTAITAPTLNFVPNREVRYAVSIDDEAPQFVTLVPKGYKAENRNRAWETSVANNAHYGTSKHTIARPGYHTLKVWMVEPAVVLQKLVVNLGGLKPSYLGPPESFHQ